MFLRTLIWIVLVLQTSGGSATEAGPDSVTVVAGEHYGSPPGGQEWLLGADYRDLWTTPVRLEVLDLQAFAGGLEPVMRVGGLQTLGLALKGGDGRDYSFRSIDKVYSPEVIPTSFRGTFIEDVIQDQIAANFPGVQVVAYPIEQAAGVLGLPDPKLVVMPDDEALGEFREDFAGVVGIIVEFPQPVSDTNPGFHGAIEILDPDDFWEDRQAGIHSLPNSRAFLRARLIDLLLNDWDRHRNQWRWARFPDRPRLEPIPEDRDQVFTDFRGLLLGLSRLQGAKYVKYGDEFEPFARATKNGWDVDRFVLTDIDRVEWVEIAEMVQRNLTDEVIDEAIDRLPPEFARLRGGEVASKLRNRRDGLVEFAARYYGHMAALVDVHGTNAGEDVVVEVLDGERVSVTVAAAESGLVFFERIFVAGETREVRIYLHGGADTVETRGNVESPLTIRVISGPGSTRVDDSSGVAVRFYGSEGDYDIVGQGGTSVDVRPFTMPAQRDPSDAVSLNDTPWVPAQDWGSTTKPLAVVRYQSDPGLILGLGFDRVGYGFRKYPWATRHTLKGAFAFGVLRPLLDYKGSFRRENSRVGFVLKSRVSGLEQIRYYGLGNETPSELADDAYRISQYQVSLFPGLALMEGDARQFAVGPFLRYTNSSGTDEETALRVEQPRGWEEFGQAGIQFVGKYDFRNQRRVLEPGILVEAEGAYVLPVWDAEKAFGHVGAHLGGWLRLADPVLFSAHLRGRRVWGEYPYFEASYVGGHSNPMGVNWNRWAGDGSLAGLASLRWTLAAFRGLMPGDFGLFGMGDIGRVFLRNEESSKWHPSYGGGVFATSFDRAGALHLGVGHSPEDGTFVMLIANMAGIALP